MSDDEEWRVRRSARARNAVAAVAVAASLLGVLGVGAKSVPALGRLLVPGHGAWAARQPAARAVTRSATTAHPRPAHGVAGAHGAAGAPGAPAAAAGHGAAAAQQRDRGSARSGPGASGASSLPGMRP